jgi:hypothetical protein
MISNAFRRIGRDLRARRYVAEYVTSFAAIFLAAALLIMDIFTDTVPTTIQLSVIIALLALIVFQTTTPKEGSTDLDSVLKDRKAFGTYREYIGDAKTVWILAATGRNLQLAVLKQQVLDRGGKVRVMVQDPADAVGYQHLFRMLGQDGNPKDLDAMLDDFHKPLYQQIEVRLLGINPGFNMTILNADKPDGAAQIEFYGYDLQNIDDRMHLNIRRGDSQKWFEFWVEQYETMWAAARVEG